jgi:hypothetical protein
VSAADGALSLIPAATLASVQTLDSLVGFPVLTLAKKSGTALDERLLAEAAARHDIEEGSPGGALVVAGNPV